MGFGVRQAHGVGTPVWSGINPVGAGAVELTFRGPVGAPYTLLTTTNVAAPLSSWIPVPNGTGTFDATVTTNLDSTATNRGQFYRIRSP